MKKLLWWLAKILLIFTLPFVVLIRGSVYWHEQQVMSPHVALFGGLALTFVLLVLYLTFFFGRVGQTVGVRPGLRSRLVIAALLLGSYAMYGLFYLSSSNAKSAQVQSEYRSLHPILRMSLSTLIFMDPDLMITSADRKPGDYEKWGMKNNSSSLHYRQSSGYVHAVDLRTHSRSALRNFMVSNYFRWMGFNVMRHGGSTGDHLHVSLMSHDRPGSL